MWKWAGSCRETRAIEAASSSRVDMLIDARWVCWAQDGLY